jgi:hypothetical protein
MLPVWALLGQVIVLKFRITRHPVPDPEKDARDAVRASVEADAKATNGFLARAARS